MKGIVLASLSIAAVSTTGRASGSPDNFVPFPKTIQLPNGFSPEGIAISRDRRFFAGSLMDGAIYAGQLLSGTGSILVAGQPGRIAVGLDYNHGRLFVAGGPTGQAYVYDAHSGDELALFQLTDEPGFVNDVIVSRRAAWFTDSFLPVIYRVPLLKGGGWGEPQTLPLTGDITYQDGFNANGIETTRKGDVLVVVQSNTGKLFRVDPETGVTTEIDLGDGSLDGGDGILLERRTLYVVRNFANTLSKVALSRDLTSGTVVSEITDPAFDVPTTVAAFGRRLYLVNARFGTDPTPETEYTIVAIRRP
jgi:outer membrane protein assembly factor BamB